MTYRQLQNYLQEMDDSRLDDEVTIFDKENHEYIPAKAIKVVGDFEAGNAVIII